MNYKFYTFIFLFFFIIIPQITLSILFLYGSYYWWTNRDTSENIDFNEYSNRNKKQQVKLSQRYISKQEYLEYLNSEIWKELRYQRLVIDNYKCQQCNKNLHEWTAHCHHISYIRLLNEDIDIDLVSLCKSCHTKIHKYHGKNAKFYPLILKENNE